MYQAALLIVADGTAICHRTFPISSLCGMCERAVGSGCVCLTCLSPDMTVLKAAMGHSFSALKLILKSLPSSNGSRKSMSDTIVSSVMITEKRILVLDCDPIHLQTM